MKTKSKNMKIISNGWYLDQIGRKFKVEIYNNKGKNVALIPTWVDTPMEKWVEVGKDFDSPDEE